MMTLLEALWKYAQNIDNDEQPNINPTEFKEISKKAIELIMKAKRKWFDL